MSKEQQAQEQPQVAIPLPKAKKNLVQIGCICMMLSVAMYGLVFATLTAPILEKVDAMGYVGLFSIVGAIGVSIMTPIGGKLGDLIGRRNIVVIPGIICALAGFAFAFVRSLIPLMILRLIVSLAQGAFTAAPYIIAGLINERKDVPKAMGMLATAINALGVADALEQLGCVVRVQTAISMRQVAEPYIRNKAMCHLQSGKVVIFGCGTGNPFFSTDTAAALRANEIEADIMMKATMVDGVYDSDPKTNPNAKKYDVVSFHEVLNKDLAVMDSTAASLCKDNKLPVLVFSLEDPENIYRAVCGENIGTVVDAID